MSAPTYALEKRQCRDCGSKGSIVLRPDQGRMDCTGCGRVQEEGVTDLAAGFGGSRRDRGDSKPDDANQHTADLDRSTIRVGIRQTGFNAVGRDAELRRYVQVIDQAPDAPPDRILSETVRRLDAHRFESRASTFLKLMWEDPNVRTARCNKALCVVCVCSAVEEQNPSQAAEMRKDAQRSTTTAGPWATKDDMLRMQMLFQAAVTDGRITFEVGLSDRTRTLAATARAAVGDKPWLSGMAIHVADVVVLPMFATTGVAGGRKPEYVTAAALLFSIAAMELHPATRLGLFPPTHTATGPQPQLLPRDVVGPIVAAAGLKDITVVWDVLGAFDEYKLDAVRRIQVEVERRKPAPPASVGASALFARLQRQKAKPADDMLLAGTGLDGGLKASRAPPHAPSTATAPPAKRAPPAVPAAAAPAPAAAAGSAAATAAAAAGPKESSSA